MTTVNSLMTRVIILYQISLNQGLIDPRRQKLCLTHFHRFRRHLPRILTFSFMIECLCVYNNNIIIANLNHYIFDRFYLILHWEYNAFYNLIWVIFIKLVCSINSFTSDTYLSGSMLRKVLQNITANLFIQTKKTPNPDFLQFLPQSQIVMGANDSVDIPDQDTAIRTSNLARKLFKIDGIKRVFYGPNYISIGKNQKSNWNQLKPLIFQTIQSHYQSGQPIIKNPQQNSEGFCQQDTEVIKLIKQILYSRVRPTVQDDGGDVKYISFDQKTGVLKIAMLGSCAGCPSSSATLKNGIFKMMKHYIGEVKEVLAHDFNASKDTNLNHNQGALGNK